ncbi:AraC family transcriptional regulator [Pseudoxanthomonas kalamensis DSM 18571]|uniref:AraC family transcriptional regulator n=1 Tax=Pseudoxanthomonas kalamensis TaxID=289483 RepID=UPI001390CEFF|nr:AraC family transcriptional regulator [Pseudoxanthomonas kalamensis]KAF1712297.1 AraC family transcriptional regulator [Pseudoxanthomonas kalamensis DSM 18571]
MSDPLSQIVSLLRPRAVFANVISGKGDWAVRYREYGRPGFCIVLEGHCQLAVDGHAAFAIAAGDFVLLPTTPAFTLHSERPIRPVLLDPDALPSDGSEVRYGEPGGSPDMRSLGGAFLFDRPDPSLLVSLLPAVVHVRGSVRLSQLVAMVAEETIHPRAGSEAALARLVELLLIEAMRSSTAESAPPGLLKGLGDERLAVALTLMHARIEHPWTVAQLAKAAALSRSGFFERFTRTVGVAPMEYLLAWRMEIAKDMLRQGELRTADIAERVGYGSSSAFCAAFSRHVGVAPSRFVK